MSTQYDNIAAHYDNLTKMPPEKVEHGNIERILNPYLENAKILDLACGLGHYSRRTVELGATKVVAIDISSGMIESAKAASSTPQYTGKIDYRVANCQEPVEYADGPFDLVLAGWLLNYAPNKKVLTNTFRNAFVNLKSGGMFVGTTMPLTEDPSKWLVERHEVRPKQKNIIWTEETGKVDDGISIHVMANTEEKEADNVQFDCFHLTESAHQAAAKEAGFEGGMELQELEMPDGLKGREDEEWLRGFLTTPECTIFVATKP